MVIQVLNIIYREFLFTNNNQIWLKTKQIRNLRLKQNLQKLLVIHIYSMLFYQPILYNSNQFVHCVTNYVHQSVPNWRLFWFFFWKMYIVSYHAFCQNNRSCKKLRQKEIFPNFFLDLKVDIFHIKALKYLLFVSN